MADEVAVFPQLPIRPSRPRGIRRLDPFAWRRYEAALDRWQPQWEAYKLAAAKHERARWHEQTGTCMKCDLPMRRHPPERFWTAEAWMCAMARSQ